MRSAWSSKLTSQALEGTVLAVKFSMMSLAAGTDTDTGGEVTSWEDEGSVLAVEFSMMSLAAGTDTGGWFMSWKADIDEHPKQTNETPVS